jgi:single-strand DNA-binding protein
MNLGIFGGRLGRDAELNHMSNGDPVLNFSLAVDVGTKEAPKTMWVDCAIFGKRAQSLQPYMVTGTKATVSGRLILRDFTNKDGQPRQSLSMTCTDIDMHLPPRGSDGGSTYERPAARRSEPATKARAGDYNDMDDSIPF